MHPDEGRSSEPPLEWFVTLCAPAARRDPRNRTCPNAFALAHVRECSCILCVHVKLRECTLVEPRDVHVTCVRCSRAPLVCTVLRVKNDLGDPGDPPRVAMYDYLADTIFAMPMRPVEPSVRAPDFQDMQGNIIKPKWVEINREAVVKIPRPDPSSLRTGILTSFQR